MQDAHWSQHKTALDEAIYNAASVYYSKYVAKNQNPLDFINFLEHVQSNEVSQQPLNLDFFKEIRETLSQSPSFQTKLNAYALALKSDYNSSEYEQVFGLQTEIKASDLLNVQNYLDNANSQLFEDIRTAETTRADTSMKVVIPETDLKNSLPMTLNLRSNSENLNDHEALEIGGMDATNYQKLLIQLQDYGFTHSTSPISQVIEKIGREFKQKSLDRNQAFDLADRDPSERRADIITDGLFKSLRELQLRETQDKPDPEAAIGIYRECVSRLRDAIKINDIGALSQKEAKNQPYLSGRDKKETLELLDSETRNRELGVALDDAIQFIEGKIGNDINQTINLRFYQQGFKTEQLLGDLPIKAEDNKFNLMAYLGKDQALRATPHILRLVGRLNDQEFEAEPSFISRLTKRFLGARPVVSQPKTGAEWALGNFQATQNRKDDISLKERIAAFRQLPGKIASSLTTSLSQLAADIKCEYQIYQQNTNIKLDDLKQIEQRRIGALYAAIMSNKLVVDTSGLLDGIGSTIGSTAQGIEHFLETKPVSSAVMIGLGAVGGAAIATPYLFSAGHALYLHGLTQPAVAAGKAAASMTSSGQGLMAGASAASFNAKIGFALSDFANKGYNGHIGHAVDAIIKNPGKVAPALAILALNAYIGADYLSRVSMLQDEIAGNRFLTGGLLVTKGELLVVELTRGAIVLASQIALGLSAMTSQVLQAPFQIVRRLVGRAGSLGARRQAWDNYKASFNATFRDYLTKPLIGAGLLLVKSTRGLSKLIKGGLKMLVYVIPTALALTGEAFRSGLDTAIRRLQANQRAAIKKGINSNFRNTLNRRLITALEVIRWPSKKLQRFGRKSLSNLKKVASAIKNFGPSVDSIGNAIQLRLARALEKSSVYAVTHEKELSSKKPAPLPKPAPSPASQTRLDPLDSELDNGIDSRRSSLLSRSSSVLQDYDQLSHSATKLLENSALAIDNLNPKQIDLVEYKITQTENLSKLFSDKKIQFKEEGTPEAPSLKVFYGEQLTARVDQYGTIQAEQIKLEGTLIPLSPDTIKVLSQLAPKDGCHLSGGHPLDAINLLKIFIKQRSSDYVIKIDPHLMREMQRHYPKEIKELATARPEFFATQTTLIHKSLYDAANKARNSTPAADDSQLITAEVKSTQASRLS